MNAGRCVAVALGALALTLVRALVPTAAHALVVTARESPPAEVGQTVELTAMAQGVGQLTYTWDLGDGTRIGPQDSPTVQHAYAAPGHYVVIVIARDDTGVRSHSFVQTVHWPLDAAAPTASSTIVWDGARRRVCAVNPDHDSVSCLDDQTLARVFEAEVGAHPRTLALSSEGELWVACDGSSSVVVVGADGARVADIALPYGAHPFGIAPSPSGTTMYVTLSGKGQLAMIDTAARDIAALVDVGASPSGIAVSGDGARILVTRFISPADHGEVVEVSASTHAVVRRLRLEESPGPDTEATSRGVPNYLRSVLVDPDGRRAFVLSKQDNTRRGGARDGLPLTFETTTRTIVSALDLAQGREIEGARVDINNRSLGLAGSLSRLGDYLFVALQGTNGVTVLDTYDGRSVGGRNELGSAPDGVALGGDGRLYVHAFLSRSVVVLDASGVLSSRDFSLPIVAEAQTVTEERLPAEVLQGKRIFYDASDPRMALDGYLACASCHLDGFEDGRVWDFTDRGEGLRNTTSLLGKRGTGHGPLHWTANFDEVQDFEHDIRFAFGGTGFMSDADFDAGTRGQTLGDPKAGTSVALDALAAYLESLDRAPDSPHRDPDGTLTEEGWAGHVLFERAGCRACHAGPDFTDSAEGRRHDVGTLSETSGSRLGGPIDGLDTPTLRGVWQTAPYLHDGSAPTLLEAIASPDGRHGNARELTEVERSQLIAYLLQIDNTAYEDERELAMPTDAGSSEAGAPFDAGTDAGPEPESVPAPEPVSRRAGNGGCTVSASGGSSPRCMPLIMLALALYVTAARGRRQRTAERRVTDLARA